MLSEDERRRARFVFEKDRNVLSPDADAPEFSPVFARRAGDLVFPTGFTETSAAAAWEIFAFQPGNFRFAHVMHLREQESALTLSASGQSRGGEIGHNFSPSANTRNGTHFQTAKNKAFSTIGRARKLY